MPVVPVISAFISSGRGFLAWWDKLDDLLIAGNLNLLTNY
jgi:hypothetical protein